MSEHEDPLIMQQLAELEENLKAFYLTLGLQEDDIIRVGVDCLEPVENLKTWNAFRIKLKSAVPPASSSIIRGHKAHIYFCPAIMNPETSGNKEDDVLKLSCLVFDVDYKSEAHPTGEFENKEKALEFIKSLKCRPTFTNETGNGYHLYFALKEPLECTEETKEQIKYMVNCLGIDTCSKSFVQFYRIPYSTNWKDESGKTKCKIIESTEMKYHFDELFEAFTSTTKSMFDLLDFEPQTPKKNVTTTKPKATKRNSIQKLNGLDRSRKAYALIAKGFKKGKTLNQVAKDIAKCPRIYGHYKNDEHLRKDILRVFNKLKNLIKMPNAKIKYLDTAYDLSKPFLESMHKYEDVFSHPISEITLNAFKVLEKAFYSFDKSIAGLQCGLGKTTWAFIHACAYADEDNKYYIAVSDKNRGDALVEKFREVGIETFFLHGFDKDKCTEDIKWYQAYNEDSVCKTCTNKRCEFRLRTLRDNRYDFELFPINIITHDLLLTGLMLNKISHDANIIVDENVNPFSDFLLLENESFLWTFLGKEIQQRLMKELNSIKINSFDGKGGSYKINFRVTENEARALFKKLSKKLDSYKDGLINKITSFLQFFKGTFTCYAVYVKQSNTFLYHFRKGKLDFSFSNKFMLLDASAVISEVNWKDFTTFSCKDLIFEYPNTVIHPVEISPTKNSFKKKETFKVFNDIINKVTGTSVFLATNKKTSPETEALLDELRTYINKRFFEVIELQRGSIIGSNLASHCDVAILATSAFTNVSDIVLSTSLSLNRPVNKESIWNANDKLNINGFWLCNEHLRKIQIFKYIYFVHQTILRGQIRNGSTLNYNAIVPIKGINAYLLLDYFMPGIKINDEKVMRFLAGENSNDLRHFHKHINAVKKQL